MASSRRDITSANATAVYTLNLFPAGIKLEQFSADGAWSHDNYETVGTVMGVDGHMSAGYTPVEKEVTFHFQPNSPTIEKLNVVWQTVEVSKTPLWGNIVIKCPSIKTQYVLANVVLVNYKLMPSAARMLEPVDATFRCESITAMPL